MMGSLRYFLDPAARPERSDTGHPTIAVSAGAAQTLWNKLEIEGATMHSSDGSTVWAVEALCKRFGRPYKVLQAKDAAGEVLGLCVQLANADVEREGKGILVGELRTWAPPEDASQERL